MQGTTRKTAMIAVAEGVDPYFSAAQNAPDRFGFVRIIRKAGSVAHSLVCLLKIFSHYNIKTALCQERRLILSVQSASDSIKPSPYASSTVVSITIALGSMRLITRREAKTSTFEQTHIIS